MLRKERKEVSLSVLKTPELNSRIHPEKQVEEIRRGLRKWGQYKNIVIDEENLVLAGNGLVEAMRAEGYKKATAVVLYGLSKNDRTKLILADNKTAGLGIDNLANIEQLIKELDGDFDIPGFDDDILNSISAASDQISAALDGYGKATEENLAEIDAHSGANDEAEDEPGPEAFADKAPHICPQCGAEIWL